jgi:hypothetical protein
MPEAPRRAWDRFSGSHFAGMNDHDSFCAACDVLREELASLLLAEVSAEDFMVREGEVERALDRVFGKAVANA